MAHLEPRRVQLVVVERVDHRPFTPTSPPRREAYAATADVIAPVHLLRLRAIVSAVPDRCRTLDLDMSFSNPPRTGCGPDQMDPAARRRGANSLRTIGHGGIRWRS